MQKKRKKFKEWLAILPEKDYLRIVYVGKLQILSRGIDGNEKVNNAIELEEMINEIWKVSSIQNEAHRISGHISYTNEFHVCQLIEGRPEEVLSLMANIRKDPRLIIYKEFSKTLSTKNHYWYEAMCFTCQISTAKVLCKVDEDTTPAEMFDNLENTFKVRLEGSRIFEFYKKGIDIFLLKYVSMIPSEN